MNHTENFNRIMGNNKPQKKEKIVMEKIKARENMNALQTSIAKCSIAGNTVHLPPIHEGVLDNYADVRKAFLNAGATYKRNTFVFPNDALPYIDRLMGGENVNIKKEFQFFATPPALAKRLVELANINCTNMVILEPSAGQGAIVNAILEEEPTSIVQGFELMDINRQILEKNKKFTLIGNDFLKSSITPIYDRIIANPPFSKNQDITHIKHMYKCLDESGRLISIASKHWQFSQGKKETAFRNWLDEIGGYSIPLERGDFKESGTMIEACIVVIDK